MCSTSWSLLSVCNVRACAAVVGAAVLPIHRILWCHALAADLHAHAVVVLMLFDKCTPCAVSRQNVSSPGTKGFAGFAMATQTRRKMDAAEQSNAHHSMHQVPCHFVHVFCTRRNPWVSLGFRAKPISDRQH